MMTNRMLGLLIGLTLAACGDDNPAATATADVVDDVMDVTGQDTPPEPDVVDDVMAGEETDVSGQLAPGCPPYSGLGEVGTWIEYQSKASDPDVRTTHREVTAAVEEAGAVVYTVVETISRDMPPSGAPSWIVGVTDQIRCDAGGAWLLSTVFEFASASEPNSESTMTYNEDSDGLLLVPWDVEAGDSFGSTPKGAFTLGDGTSFPSDISATVQVGEAMEHTVQAGTYTVLPFEVTRDDGYSDTEYRHVDLGAIELVIGQMFDSGGP